MSRYLNDLGAPHTPAIVNLSVAHEFGSTAHFRYIAGSSIADEFRRTRATYSRDLVQKIRAHGEQPKTSRGAAKVRTRATSRASSKTKRSSEQDSRIRKTIVYIQDQCISRIQIRDHQDSNRKPPGPSEYQQKTFGTIRIEAEKHPAPGENLDTYPGLGTPEAN